MICFFSIFLVRNFDNQISNHENYYNDVLDYFQEWCQGWNSKMYTDIELVTDRSV